MVIVSVTCTIVYQLARKDYLNSCCGTKKPLPVVVAPKQVGKITGLASLLVLLLA